MTQTDLADYFGVARPSLARALKELEDEKMIEATGKVICSRQKEADGTYSEDINYFRQAVPPAGLSKSMILLLPCFRRLSSLCLMDKLVAELQTESGTFLILGTRCAGHFG